MKDFKVYQASGYLTKLVTDASDVRKTYDEISGSLVEFDTPISAPLAELLVDINPVQDLHGQDAPYPAGGGKNIMHPATSVTASQGISVTNDNGKITLNGEAVSGSDVYISFEPMVIQAGYIMAFMNSFISETVYFLNDSTHVDYFSASMVNRVINAQSLSSTYGKAFNKMRITFTQNVTLSNANFSPMVVLDGADTTTWSPYSNICPITGWTGANVYHSGEDTSDPTTYTISWQDDAGTVYGGTYDFVSGGLKPYKEYDSYNGETLTGEWMSSMDKYVAGTTPTIGAQVVDLDGYDTTVQLTPQEINTLIGVNNIWADTGDVSVKYRTH